MMQFIDLAEQYKRLKKDIDQRYLFFFPSENSGRFPDFFFFHYFFFFL